MQEIVLSASLVLVAFEAHKRPHTRVVLYCWPLTAITQVHRVYWAKFCVRFDAVVAMLVAMCRCDDRCPSKHDRFPLLARFTIHRGGRGLPRMHARTRVRAYANVCVLRVCMGGRESVCIYNYFFA